MKRFIVAIVTFIIFNGFLIGHAESPPLQQVKPQAAPLQKIPALSQVKPKKPVKIKLKRTPKGEYFWEIDGESVDDIINADKKLRKGLGME